MEEKVRVSILLGIYGKLLTKKQQDFMDLYYNEDLSLSEIADNNDITRQAVRTILIKSKNKLEEFEKKLKFMNKEKKIKEYIEQIQITDKNKKTINKILEQIDF